MTPAVSSPTIYGTRALSWNRGAMPAAALTIGASVSLASVPRQFAAAIVSAPLPGDRMLASSTQAKGDTTDVETAFARGSLLLLGDDDECDLPCEVDVDEPPAAKTVLATASVASTKSVVFISRRPRRGRSRAVSADASPSGRPSP